MIVSEAKMHTWYWRALGGKRLKCHTMQTIYHLRCDNCEGEFTRTAKEINRSSTTHVCGNCDGKKFAQRQSAYEKRFNKIDASSTKPI